MDEQGSQNNPSDKASETAGSVPASASTTSPVPAQTTAPVQVQAPMAPAVQTTTVASQAKIPLSPEQKQAKRKEMFKRLGIVAAGLYGGLLLLIHAWGFALGGKDLSLFKTLGSKQKFFDAFLMKVIHFQFGILAVAFLLTATFFVIRSLLVKNEEHDKKKAFSKKAMLSGGAFFLTAVLWLLSVIFVGAKLVTVLSGGISTDPADTIGLTAPIEVTFDARELPIDTDSVSILSYTWNFGDGGTANGSKVSHRFTQKGSADGKYTVKLTVGLEDLITKQEFTDEYSTEVVITNEQTSASFTMNPDSGEIPLKVKFDASSSYDPDGEISSYEWDLDGDGEFDDATGETATYTYEQEGTFDVALRVTDNNGEYNVAEEQVEAGTVNGLRAIIQSDVGADDIYYVGEKYAFSADLSRVDSGSIQKYNWDFGDGSSKVSSKSTSHTFSKAGKFTVKLAIQDSAGNTDQTSKEIIVVDQGTPPVALISSDPAAVNGEITGPFPLTVEFDASKSTDKEDDIIQYDWDFNSDEEIDDSGDKASYTFEEEGEYTTTLTITDAGGNQDAEEVQVTVTAQGIVAKLSADVTNGEVPMTVHFDASASTYKGGSIVSYEYDFGDGSEPYVSGSTVTYKYTKTGTFTVSLKITGADGETDTTTTQIVVRPVSLTACFTVNTDSGSAPLFVTVDPSCTKGSVKNYSWEFGDGDVSFDRDGGGVHTYDKPGTYTITLEVTESTQVVDTFSKEIVVD